MGSIIDDSPGLSRLSKLDELYFQYVWPAGNFAYKRARIEAMIRPGRVTVSLTDPEEFLDMFKKNSSSHLQSMTH
jgi:hypothetical protein